MEALGSLLVGHRDELIVRWHERWRAESASSEALAAAPLKALVTEQVAVIGQALLDGSYQAESPRQLWARRERLNPEALALAEVPIQEVVEEYWLLVSTIRDWLNEQQYAFAFGELTYFYEAIFELVAQSIRRYAEYEAQRVRRERSEYLAGLAHQMRGPLTVLAAGIGLLQSDKAMPSSKMLSGMARSIKRLTRQVTGVMRLERFSGEDVPVQPEWLHPAVIVEEVIHDNEEEAARKQLGFGVSVDPASRMQVDPELLTDILGNLVQNGVKYTEQGTICVEMEESEERILFRVIDTGSGISRERQQELFKPVHPSKRGGVGLGLTLARRAVVAQGGDIGVESTPGQGTTFWFWLPKVVGEPSRRSQ